MADQKPAPKPAEKPDPPAKTGLDRAEVVAIAAASIDPAVQQLLAARSAAELNGDEAALADVDQKLADLIN